MKRIIVGLNQFTEEQATPPVMEIDPKVEREQVARLQRFKANRDQAKSTACRARLVTAAKEGGNMVPFIFEAVKNQVTLGEVIESLTPIFGRYRP